MTVSGRTAVFAFGRQTAEGTALTAPKFEMPVGTGGIQPARDVQPLPWANDSRDDIGHYVSRTSGDFSVELPALPVSVGGLLYAGLGALATAGEDPYTHTTTPANSLPWNTMFFGVGGEYLTLADAKVSTLEVSGSAGQPLNVSVSGQGKTVTRPQPSAKWGAATLDEAVEPFFSFIGSTIKLAAEGASPVTVRNVPNVSATVENNIDPIQTDAIGYGMLPEGPRSVSVNCNDVVLDNFDFLKTIFFGSTSGTTLSSVPIYGSAEFTFVGSDGVAAATRSLKLTFPRLMWNVAQWPGTDTSGAPVRYSLTGAGALPSSGSIVTAVLINTNAGTAY